MGKKFMGLGGTDHFWDRAKAWILSQITSAVTAKIAEVVANAPEDLDTLKEIADWISAHANDAAAMNTQITENKNNIAANSSSISAMNTQITENKNNIAANSSSISAMNTQITENKNNIAANSSSISAMNTQITENKNNIAALSGDAAAMNTQITENKNNIAALQTSVAGKADKEHTHTKAQITDFPTSLKNPNALTVNSKTYDGSSAVDAGVQTVANGGTGATTAKDAFMNLANGLSEDYGPLDTEYVIYKNTAGTHWGLYTLSTFWGYIKGKISSVLGLTADNYGGTAAKAVEVVDYVDTSRTVRIGYHGLGVTADKLLRLAGYTEYGDSSVELKGVSKKEIIKWLGIPRIKYADYQMPSQTFTQFQPVSIELSKFSSEVTPNNVLCFMVIYWSRVQVIASGDWGSAASTGLKCSLIPLGTGTGWCIIRCVYMV